MCIVAGLVDHRLCSSEKAGAEASEEAAHGGRMRTEAYSQKTLGRPAVLDMANVRSPEFPGSPVTVRCSRPNAIIMLSLPREIFAGMQTGTVRGDTVYPKGVLIYEVRDEYKLSGHGPPEAAALDARNNGHLVIRSCR